MPHRLLAFLLFGTLAFVAFDGFEGAIATGSPAAVEDSEMRAMHGGNPWPPPPK